LKICRVLRVKEAAEVFRLRWAVTPSGSVAHVLAQLLPGHQKGAVSAWKSYFSGEKKVEDMPRLSEVEGRFKRAKPGDPRASFSDAHPSILRGRGAVIYGAACFDLLPLFRLQSRLACLVPGHEDEVGRKRRRRYQPVDLRRCEPQNRTPHAHASCPCFDLTHQREDAAQLQLSK
jgi:hypothetical protein